MSRSVLGRVGLKLVALGVGAIGLPVIAAASTTAASPTALPNTTTAVQPFLSVLSSQRSLAPDGPLGQAPVLKYKWLLQEDITGNPHQYPDTSHPEILPPAQQPSATQIDLCHPVIPAGYPNPYPYGNQNFPNGCNWPSVHLTHSAPVVTSGDQSDWASALTISGMGPTDVAGHPCFVGAPNVAFSSVDCAGLPAATRQHKPLPAGKYIVSVMADGFEIGGARFSIPMTTDDTVHVLLNPGPIPLGTLQILAFADMAPTGGAYAAETDPVLAGFTAYLTDFTDAVTQDYYGNPICTTYKLNTSGQTILDKYGRPTVDHLAGPNGCVSGADGVISIPNLASGRYAVSLTPPDRSWIQTTTLEGAHDFDVWLQANSTGLDTELVVAGEPVPFVQFGFAKVSNNPCPISALPPDIVRPCPNPNARWADPANQVAHPNQYGEITGRIVGAEPYVPGIGGIAGQNGANGQAGIRVDSRPVKDAYIALADLTDGDLTKYVQPVSLNPEPGVLDSKDAVIGAFDIKGVPNGSYLMAIWDYNQDYAFDSFQVDVVNGDIVKLGNTPLIGWFTRIDGHVFIDKNGNGKMDPGEQGVPDFDMQILNRTNQGYEQGQNVAKTNDAGEYSFKEGYPLGQFNVLQFFNTRYKTTGTTCQADNDPQEHTTLTPAVDLSTLNIIGLNGRCDIGVQPYSTDPTANDNGGIVSTVTYQAYRTVLQSNLNANNAFDVGIPDYVLDLTQATACTSATPANLCKNGYQLDPAKQNQYAKHPIDPALVGATGSNTVYASEHYYRPTTGCTPRMADGTVLGYNYQEALQPGGECVESSMQGTAFAFGTDNLPLYPNDPAQPGCKEGKVDPLGHLSGSDISPGGQYIGPPFDPNSCVLHGVQTVDGNYGFVTPGPGDYLVHVDMRSPAMVDLYGKPKYHVSTEANVNQYDGPQWVPQNGDYSAVQFGNSYYTGNAPARNGPLEENPNTYSAMPHSQCAGPQYTVNNTKASAPDYVSNPSFLAATGAAGGPFEGTVRQRCDTILVHVQNGQSIAPNFFLYTDVPEATIFAGYAVDDISVSTDKKSTGLGEVQGIPNLPIGLYDWTGRQIDEFDSDPNGQYEVMTPSTNTFNCKTASGACVSVYRFVGNDPGQPARPNLNWNPAYRTIAATFQAWPGDFMPSDVAPWRVVPSFEGAGSQFGVAVVCGVKAEQPQMFNISKPYLSSADFRFVSRTFAAATATHSGRLTRTTSVPNNNLSSTSYTFVTGDVGRTVGGVAGIAANTTIASLRSSVTASGLRTGTSLVAAAGTFTAATLGRIVTGSGLPASPIVTITAVNLAASTATLSSGSGTSAANFTIRQSAQLSSNVTANQSTGNFTLRGPGGFANGTTTFTVSNAVPFTFVPSDVGSTITVAAPDGSVLPTGTTIAAFTNSKTVTLSTAATTTRANLSFTVTSPMVANVPITIKGLGFGSPQGAGTVTLERIDTAGAPLSLGTVNSWTDTSITITPTGSLLSSAGQYRLMIRNNSGREATNTVTFHVLGDGYSPNVLEVGPGKQFDPNGFPARITNGSALVLVQEVLRIPGAGPILNGAAVSVTGPTALTNAFPAGTTAMVIPIPFLGLTLLLTSSPASGFLGTQSATMQIGSAGDGIVKGAVQRALEQSAANANSQNLVVVYPNVNAQGLSPQAWTPLSAYFENIIVHSPVRLQGTGPGGLFTDAAGVTTAVPGSVLDGRFLNSNSAQAPSVNDNVPGNEPYLFDWLQLSGSIPHTNGVALEVEGEVVYVIGNPNLYKLSFRPSIDGFQITGGDQKNIPGLFGEAAATTGLQGTVSPGEAPPADAQGGAITLLADAANFRIGNNVMQWNSGTYGGAIRSGTPQVENNIAGGSRSDALNNNLDIHHNRIVANGGTNFAGAIALFRGTNNYRIHDNVICGNLSAEYGGGISHFGLSMNGQIDHNKIMLNQAIDEGGGIQIAGEPQLNVNLSTPTPQLLSDGAGPVSIHDNYIGDNLAQDDGAGIRFLMAGNWRFDVYNNMITNNVSAHEGGGIALDDATDVLVYNNTIAKNLTTATAVTSNGQPDPAGLSTGRNSEQLQACNLGNPNHVADCHGQPPQPANPVVYSRPVLFNNVFWDNRAGSWDGTRSSVTGIGLPLDTSQINVWDVGVTAGTASSCGTPTLPCLNPHNNTFTSPGSVAHLDGGADGTNFVGPTPVASAPNYGRPVNTVGFVNSYDAIVSLNPWRIQPRFRPTSLVTVDLPANVLGDYHLNGSTSPAFGLGSSLPNYPLTDIDGDARSAARVDSGADQVVPGLGGGGNLYSIRSVGGLTPIGSASTANAFTGSLRSDPSVSPIQFATYGQANAAGNTATVIVPGRPLNTKVTNSSAGLIFSSNSDVKSSGNLALAGAKTSDTKSIALEPASIPGGAIGGGQFKIQPRGAPPSAVIPPTHRSSRPTSILTSMPAEATALGLLALALALVRRRRSALIAATENGGHDVRS